MGEKTGFIIDTNSYSGNFERELCTYMTGNIRDCEVGEEYANMFLEKYKEPLNDVCYVPDEHSCYRPVIIFKGLNNSHYTSVLIKFDNELNTEKIEFLKERAYEFFKLYGKNVKIIDFRIIKENDI